MDTNEGTMSHDHGAMFRNSEAIEITGETIDFSFGENWKKYLQGVGDEDIARAEQDFKEVAGIDSLVGQSFLDIGCGSGMNSLVAFRMGAKRVLSIDYDPNSVEAAKYLRSKFQIEKERWEIRHGSALDSAFMSSLGKFPFVLSWGVLHHTGDMWRAIDNASKCVAPGGRFFIALYNHTKYAEKWLTIKRIYNRSPGFVKKLMILGHGTYGYTRGLLHGRTPRMVRKSIPRGMDYWRDIEDWLGGLPYEYCKPDEIVDRLVPSGFSLQKLKTTRGLGCNQFVFDLQERG